MYAFFNSPMHATIPAYLMLLDLITQIIKEMQGKGKGKKFSWRRNVTKPIKPKQKT
jgi:hypothetical protein